MMCYKDITFCPFYTECRDGENCPRKLTEEVQRAADAIKLPTAQFVGRPKQCFIPKEEY